MVTNILKQVKGFEQISQWASDHHERVYATGYPTHKGKSELSIEARIIAVVDVFQTLVQKTPYYKELPPMVDNHLNECWNVALLLN